MERGTSDIIADSRALIEVMGRWPSFHDAHLLEVVRTDDDVRVVVHVFEMTDEVDAAGYFVLRKHHLVRLDLLGVITCNVPAGYEGDTLDSLTARKDAEGVLVVIESVIDSGLNWHAVCGEARIREVIACDPKGRARSGSMPQATDRASEAVRPPAEPE